MVTEIAAPAVELSLENLSIRDALKLLRENTEAELEATTAAQERARQRVKLVGMIERTLGFKASEIFSEARPAFVQALKEIKDGTNGRTNGNGHAKPNVTVEDRVATKAQRAQEEIEKIVGNLPPQLATLYKFLDSRRGMFTSKEQIQRKLNLTNDNQASPMVTKLRAEGISVEAAKTLRSEGEQIPDDARGWRLV